MSLPQGSVAPPNSSRTVVRSSCTEPGATICVPVPGVPAEKSATLSSVTVPGAAAATDGAMASAARVAANRPVNDRADCTRSSLLIP